MKEPPVNKTKLMAVPGIAATLIILGGCMTVSEEHEKGTPARENQEFWQVESEHGTLFGTLDLPEMEGKIPVILMVSGSGPTDRDGNSEKIPKPNDSLKMLGRWFAARGYAVLRYDKRGVGESKAALGPMEETSFDAMIHDARLWMDRLRKDSRFTSLGVIGHSEGSLIALETAREEGADFVISLAGAGRPISEILREQLAAQPKIIQKRAFAILGELEQGNRVEKVPFHLRGVFAPELQTYFISWCRYDPAEIAASLEVPILVVQGSTDFQTSLKDAELLAAANPTARLAVVEGMNHILKDAPANRLRNFRTYTKQGLPLSEGLFGALDPFLAGF